MGAVPAHGAPAGWRPPKGGTTGNDALADGHGDDRLDAGSGADTLSGAGGADGRALGRGARTPRRMLSDAKVVHGDPLFALPGGATLPVENVSEPDLLLDAAAVG